MTLPPEVLSLLLGPLGTLVLALVVIAAFLREWVVPRGRLDEMRHQRDDALSLADKGWETNARITSQLSDRNARLENAFSRGLLSEAEVAQTMIGRRPKPTSDSPRRQRP